MRVVRIVDGSATLPSANRKRGASLGHCSSQTKLLTLPSKWPPVDPRPGEYYG